MIEVITVIGIIAVLAAIAIPQFMAYRQRGYDAKANADAKNAFTAAQDYFTTFPGGTVSISELMDHGFVQSSEIILAIPFGSRTNLQITSHHIRGIKTYTINSSGSISF